MLQFQGVDSIQRIGYTSEGRLKEQKNGHEVNTETSNKREEMGLPESERCLMWLGTGQGSWEQSCAWGAFLGTCGSHSQFAEELLGSLQLLEE